MFNRFYIHLCSHSYVSLNQHCVALPFFEGVGLNQFQLEDKKVQAAEKRTIKKGRFGTLSYKIELRKRVTQNDVSLRVTISDKNLLRSQNIYFIRTPLGCSLCINENPCVITTSFSTLCPLQVAALDNLHVQSQFRSRPPEKFLEKVVLKICNKFTGEHHFLTTPQAGCVCQFKLIGTLMASRFLKNIRKILIAY